MKNPFKRANKINKGAPSGFVISLIFHAVAFFVAGLFVVFTVLPKEEPEFKVPPPVERPKMNLKKPKVKIKKSSQPKPSSRIVAKVKTAKMPEIQIPDLIGTGEGLLGGLGAGGEFMDLPAVPDIVMYGSEESIGNDLVGYFYDFKRRRNGNDYGAEDPGFRIQQIFREFLDSGWNKASLAKYYRSPKKLYTTTVIIPETPSLTAPMAFGEDTPGYLWGVLYEGELVSHKDIRFRFWGMGDNYLFVGVDGKTELTYWLGNESSSASNIFGEYATRTEPGTPMTYAYGHNGNWIDLKAGERKKLQVLIGESDGGGSSYMLCVEVEGVDYPRNPYLGGTTLPIFQTAVQTRTQVEELERVIYPGDATVNEGPVFQDFEPRTVTLEGELAEEEVATAEEEVDTMRTWTIVDGRTVQGELHSTMGDKAWLTTEDGRELKIPFEQLSNDDLTYLELSNPPELKIRFSYRTDQVPLPPQAPGRDYTRRPVTIMDYFFGAEVEVIGKRSYSYPLTVEYFAIGSEIEGDHYVLWQRGSRTFTPSKKNNYKVEFHGPPIRRIEAQMWNTGRIRGEDYDGYLVTVTDQRGEIIQYRASNEFLYRNLHKLKKLPITRHFDKHCTRVAPPRPKDDDRIWAQSVFDRTL